MFEIRRYDQDDQAAVVRLHNDALLATGAHLGPGPWDEDLEHISATYLAADGEFLVGVADGELVAMGALRRVDARVAEIKRMRTAPAHQRSGLGRRMLTRLELRATELGYQHLVLDTTAKQIAARRLYETAGYRETRRERGPGDDENIIYEKDIVTDD